MESPIPLTITVKGQQISLSASVRGTGPSILFLHGLMHSRAIWERVSRLLEPDHEIIAVDLPGFGDSAPTKDTSFANHAEIIAAAIRTFSQERRIVAVVADSLSAALVIAGSEHEPLPQVSILLSGCPIDGLPFVLKVLPVSLLMKPTLRLLRVLPRSWSYWIVYILSRYTVHGWSVRTDEILHGVLHSDPETARLLFRALRPPISKTILANLSRYDCAFVRGRFDRIVSHRSMEQQARTLNAHFAELAASGHTPMIEEPDKYAQWVRERISHRPAESSLDRSLATPDISGPRTRS
jgi:pimeloyl-ACP methyl ester carboxylesterase